MDTNNYHLHASIRRKRDKGTVCSNNGLIIFFVFFVCYLIWLFATYSPVNKYFIGNQTEIRSVILVVFYSYLFSDFVYKLFWLRIMDNNIISYLYLPISKNSLINDCLLLNLAYYKNYYVTTAFVALVVKANLSYSVSFNFCVVILIAFLFFSILNSSLAYFIQNIRRYKIWKYVFSIIVYFFVIFLSILFIRLISSGNIIRCLIIVSVISIPVSYYLSKKAICLFIYNDMEGTIPKHFTPLFLSVWFNKPMYKLIIRSKNLLVNTLGIFWYLMLFVHIYNYEQIEDENKYLILFSEFVIAAIIPRTYTIQKMFSICSDCLVTIQKHFFEKALLDLYNMMVGIAILCSLVILIFLNDIYYALNFIFSLLGLIMPLYTLYSLFDPGRVDMFSIGFKVNHWYTNLKPNLILFPSLIILGTIFFYASKYFSKEIFTLFNAFQFLIVFLTRKYWIKIANNVYMKKRYVNLAQCRGE